MSEELNLLRRRFERERLARKQAENIAEVKSRELFVKSQELEKTAKAELKAKHEIELLLRAFEAFTSRLNTSEIADHLCRYVDKAISGHNVSVYLRKENGFQAVSQKNSAFGDPLGRNRASFSEKIFQFTELTASVVIENVRQAEVHHNFRFWDDTHSAMIIPLSYQRRIIGYLTAENPIKGTLFEEAQVRIAQALANEAAIALENARLFQKVEKLSTTDPLTGAHNRRYFDETARKFFKLSVRHNRALSALMLDIDYFKKVNDTYGHDTGDEVLKKVAQTCRRLTREQDLCARYGGEEFCFLFPETNASEAFIIAEKLRTAIAELDWEANGRNFFVTASFGVSECVHPGDSMESLIKRCDEALYAAKGKGRNCVVTKT
jgi:diguanylate cyclase (GGDEF)-like protein